MKKNLLIILFLLTSSIIFAQHTFKKIYGPATGIYVHQCTDGGYMVSGDSINTGFLLKVDMDGDTIWAKAGYPILIPKAAKQTLDGGFVMCGSKSDTTVVIKTDDQGTVEWTTDVFDTANFYGRSAINVFQHQDSSYTVGSQEFRFMQNIPFIMSDIDKNGTFVYPEFEISMTNYIGNISSSQIRENPAHGYDMVSVITSTGLGVEVSRAGRMDSAGSVTWLNSFYDGTMTSDFYCYAGDHTLDNGNILIGRTDLFTGTEKMFLMKLDSLGDSTWTKSFYPGGVFDVIALPDSGYMMLTDSGSQGNIHLIRTDKFGTKLWARYYGGASGNHIQRTPDGGFIIVGTTGGNALLIKTDSLGYVLPPSNITAAGPLTFCPGDSVILSAPLGFHYLWSNGDTTSSSIITTAGDYFVTVTDNFPLHSVSDTVTVDTYTTVVPVITETALVLTSTPAVSYTWSRNGTVISNSDSISYVPSTGGDYTVSTVDSNGCITESAPYSFVMPGVFENSGVDATLIFRNTGRFLEVRILETNTRLDIYSIDGKLVNTFNPSTGNNSIYVIDLEKYSNGTYIISSQNKTETNKQKFVINR